MPRLEDTRDEARDGEAQGQLTLFERAFPEEPELADELEHFAERFYGLSFFKDAVRHKTETTGRRILIYGDSGLGKTTFAVSAPNPFVFDFSNDLSDLTQEFQKKRPRTIDVFQEALAEKEIGQFGTIVIDKLDDLNRMIESQVARDAGKKSFGDFSYGKGHDLVLPILLRIRDQLDWVRRTYGCHIILTADCVINTIPQPGGDTYMQYGLNLAKKIAPVWTGWCQEVLWAHYESTVEKGQGFQPGKIRGGTNRYIATGGILHAVCKRRIELPDVMPLSWSAYEKHLPKEKEKVK